MLRRVVIASIFALAAASLPMAQEVGLPEMKVEPANGLYTVQNDGWVYNAPSTEAGQIQQIHSGDRLNVTGATRNFVLVPLANGQNGYVPQSTMILFRPADKNFILSTDSAVYSCPHLSCQTLATVHRGHNVHVRGAQFYYLKIRMSNGLEGFIPVSAVE